MSVTPIPARSAPIRRPGHQLISAAAARVRKVPDPSGLARRHLTIVLIKWLLPVGALLLLASIALWPELGRVRDTVRMTIEHTAAGAATMTDARYRGIDDHGRPYTVTAATAQQDGPDRINLTMPKADITLTNGTWLMVQARRGVYLQNSGQLDLSRDVTLYRDDGTTLKTASASIDVKAGAAASDQPTHAEGPFGTLDAQGFMVTDKGTAIQFDGPAKLILNGSQP
ncbi:MAG TPA: LPS export ABC transporter periplasmic protein LptC [Acetobacteraceae bacterium]|jgi:lipopolysaccharide export system protein LptC|nr:LPS export ABC transporter periplasmic protein LptC [Acetobacteraceae bacterium]